MYKNSTYEEFPTSPRIPTFVLDTSSSSRQIEWKMLPTLSLSSAPAQLTDIDTSISVDVDIGCRT